VGSNSFRGVYNHPPCISRFPLISAIYYALLNFLYNDQNDLAVFARYPTCDVVHYHKSMKPEVVICPSAPSSTRMASLNMFSENVHRGSLYFSHSNSKCIVFSLRSHSLQLSFNLLSSSLCLLKKLFC
jgi:hypothetical protein